MSGMRIKLKNLQKKFFFEGKEFVLLSGLNIEFLQGQGTVIRGVSGSGKSTLLSIITSLEPITSGHIFFDEQCVHSLPSTEKEALVREQFGIIFQQPYLLKELTVRENIMLKAKIQGLLDATKKADIVLDKVGLADKADKFPQSLSGGEQQRVALARALIHNPAFIIADEPTAHLDHDNKRRVIALLQDIISLGTGVIITTHDETVAQAFGRQLYLHNGYLHEQ